MMYMQREHGGDKHSVGYVRALSTDKLMIGGEVYEIMGRKLEPSGWLMISGRSRRGKSVFLEIQNNEWLFKALRGPSVS